MIADDKAEVEGASSEFATGAVSQPRHLRPLVAIGYGPRCVPVMQLAEAAAGICDLLWIIDGSLPEMEQMNPLLRRFGCVVDRGGIDRANFRRQVRAHRPDGLVTYLDAGMIELAELGRSLGLPFCSPASAAALTDKAVQRQRLRGAGFPVPTCHVLSADPGQIAVANTDRQSWPAIMKPRSAQGSRFMFLASNATQAAEFLDGLGPNRPEMVIEDYLPDDPRRTSTPHAAYLSVETIVSRGVIDHLALTGRFPLAANFRETGFFIPADLEAGEKSEVLELCSAAITALEVETGCLHTEVKFTPEGLRIIEINGRVGGGVPEMLERATGVSLLALTLRMALGQPALPHGPLPTERIGYRFFLQPPAVTARVAEIVGIDTFTDRSGADSISIHQGPGADFDWRDGTRNYIVAVVGSADGYEELQTIERLLQREISVTYST